MAKKNMSGLFITFEGSEGSGKSTQSYLVYRYLKRRGCSCVYLREPGGTKIGEKIRSLLLDIKNISMSPLAEMLLYMACRSQLVEEVIRPLLKKGRVIICDRFLDSTFAYQGYGLGVDLKMIDRIGRFITEGIKPDLTIFMDMPLLRGLKGSGIKDRIEKRSLIYHRRVRRGYLELARSDPSRIKIVKVEKDKDATQKKIRAIIEQFLTKRRYSYLP
jgi:dTMP kinase